MSSYVVDPGTVIGRSVEVADFTSLFRPPTGAKRARVRAHRDAGAQQPTRAGRGPSFEAGPFVTAAHTESGTIAWSVRAAGQRPGPRTDHLAALERRAGRRAARARAAFAVQRWVRLCFQRPRLALPEQPAETSQSQRGDRRGVLTSGGHQATAMYYEHPAHNRRRAPSRV